MKEVLVAHGYVLVEGMRPDARLDGLPFTLKKIQRLAVENATPEQPPVWTSVEFEFPETAADRVAEALAGVLNEHGGWYSDFTVDGETFIIFADKIFRYASGDEAGRAEAAAYGRSVGVPEPQLDWGESG